MNLTLMLQKLRYLRCAWNGHPVKPRRVLYAGSVGGVCQVDQWTACACGQRSSGVERRRLQAPYPDLEAVRAARRRGDSAAAELLSRGLL